MGNISISIKRFLGNKNTVTILGVIVGIIVLYVGYNWRVNQAVKPQTVPVAKKELVSNTLITSDLVSTIQVSKSMVDQTPNLITSSNQVIGKYVKYDTTVPEGGLFYSSQLMAAEQMPNYITVDTEKGYTIYSLAVDMHSTYGNSIMPGDYIDLFVSAVSDNNKIIVAKMIESIKVKDVRDSEGKSVFSSASSSKVPAELIFAVPDEMFKLLTRADKIQSNNIQIFPVPRNKEYTEQQGTTLVASQQIQDLINSKSDLTFN